MNGILNFAAGLAQKAMSAPIMLKSEIIFQLSLNEVLTTVLVAVVAIVSFFIGRASKRISKAQKNDTVCVNENRPTAKMSDTELVAVITAAIMAMRDDEAKATGIPQSEFRVVSFKRTGRR